MAKKVEIKMRFQNPLLYMYDNIVLRLWPFPLGLCSQVDEGIVSDYR